MCFLFSYVYCMCCVYTVWFKLLSRLCLDPGSCHQEDGKCLSTTATHYIKACFIDNLSNWKRTNKIVHLKKKLLPPGLWFNAEIPGHFCLLDSSSVPQHRAKHLGTTPTGNFPQVVSGWGTQAYLCLCLLSTSISADPGRSQSMASLPYLTSRMHTHKHTR